MKFGFILPFYAVISAQTVPLAQEKCRVEGHIVNAVTNEPVRKARVTLTRVTGLSGDAGTRNSRNFTSITDTAGRFVFAELDAGGYGLDARRDGFEFRYYRLKGQGLMSPSVTLMPGDQKRDILINMTPLGSISGRVIDDDGDPIRWVQVSLMVYQYINGRQRAATNTGRVE